MSRLLLALSAPAALLAYAAVLPPASDAVIETRFLALIVTGALTALIFLAQRAPIEALAAAPLAVAAAWVIPAGPLRGTAVWLVLVVALCVAALRRLWARANLDFPTASALALAIQFLARPRLLLPLTLDLHRVTALVALPLVAALALVVLARRYSPVTLLLVTTPLITVAPGFDTAATLALLALALGEIGRKWLAPTLSWLPPAALALLAFVWQPPTVVLLALIGVAASASDSWWRQVAVTSLAPLLWWATPGLRPLHAFAVLLPVILVLAPLALAFTRPRPRWLSSAALLVVAILVVPEPAAMIAPIALAALGEDRPQTARELATLWAAILSAGALLAAGYPWLRPRPLLSVLELFHLRSGWLGAALFLCGFLVFSPLAPSISEDRRRRRLIVASAAMLLAILALPRKWPIAGGSWPLAAPIVLAPGQPAWSAPWRGRAPTLILFDTTAANVTPLAAGTVLARVSLTSADGGHASRVLRLGRDSDDWALSRPGLRSRLKRQQARPWVHWVSREQFFANEYRMIWPLASSLHSPPTHIAITRSSRLPADVTLSIFFVGAER